MLETEAWLLKKALGVAALSWILGSSVYAQAPGAGPQTSLTARAAAPIDLTGTWMAMVEEDWKYRMVTPRHGDYQGIPLNTAGRKLADEWDPAKDESAQEHCRSYGAPNIMRIPERIRISWQDEQTLKLETDAGMQTRIFNFGSINEDGRSRQGVSSASWDLFAANPAPPKNAAGGILQAGPASGSLKVVTANLEAGYVRKNGVPYSANTTLTEYFDVIIRPNGERHLLIAETVEDPVYLTQPLTLSSHFKKQADASGWNPQPCAVK